MTKNKLVSIITRHAVPNYGSKLQSYALQCAIEKLGYRVEIINFIPEYEKDRGSLFWELKHFAKCTNLVKALLKTFIIIVFQKKLRSRFVSFDRKLNLTKIYNEYSILANPPFADIYCTGSDQVWNNDLNEKYLGFEPVYFLEFARDKKCVSYAASFGKEIFEDKYNDLIKKYCEKYSKISVRENIGVKILEKAGIEAEHVLDPVLLLSKEEWSKIMEPASIENKYILVYHVSEMKKKVYNAAYYLGKKLNLPIIHISLILNNYSTRNRKFIFAPRLEEFLSLLNNAEYIVTDSFHGTAFALNLNKQFFAIYPKLHSSRLSSILDLTNLTNRKIDSSNGTENIGENVERVLANPIDYNIVNKILESERARAIAFLKNALEN